MPKLFDTHCHLDVDPLSLDLRGVLDRAWKAGVRRILIPAIHGPIVDPGFPENVWRAWGVHPGICDEIQPEAIRPLFDLRNYNARAIGECGLDVHADIPIEHQSEIFIRQLEIAETSGLPVLVHLRGAWDKGLSLLRAHARNVPWVMHSFCGSWEIAEGFLREGAFLSFSGSLCMPQARKTPRVARLAPSDRILLETDAPDMKPNDWPGQNSEPAALPLIARCLAGLRQVSVEELASRISETCEKIWVEPIK